MFTCGVGSWVLLCAAIGPGAVWSPTVGAVAGRVGAIGAAEIRIYPLKHADARHLAQVMQKAFAARRGQSSGFTFTADVRTNSLIVIAPLSRVREVENLLKELDVGGPASRVKVAGQATQPTRAGRRRPRAPAAAPARSGPYVRVYPVGELLVPEGNKPPSEKAVEAQVHDLCRTIGPVVQGVDPKAPTPPTVTGVRHLRALIINGSARVHRKAANILAELRRHRRVQVGVRFHAVTGLKANAVTGPMRSGTQLATDSTPIRLRLAGADETARVLGAFCKAGGRLKATSWHWVPDGASVVGRLGPAHRYVSAVEAELVGGRVRLRPVHQTLHEGLSVRCCPVCRDDRSAIKVRLAVEQTHMQKMHASRQAVGPHRLSAPQAQTVRFKTEVTIPPKRLALLSWTGPDGRRTVLVIEARAYENVPTTMPSLLPRPARRKPTPPRARPVKTRGRRKPRAK